MKQISDLNNKIDEIKEIVWEIYQYAIEFKDIELAAKMAEFKISNKICQTQKSEE